MGYGERQPLRAFVNLVSGNHLENADDIAW
jgi:hypothetical protein